MGFKKVVKKGFFSGFRPTQWAGLDGIKQNSKVIGGLLENSFKGKKADESLKTFDDYVVKYRLNEEDLKKKQAQCQKSSLLYVVMALAVFVYTLYLIFSASLIIASFVCAALTAFLIVYALKEQLNAFKIKQRSLKVTYKQWYLSTFKRQA